MNELETKAYLQDLGLADIRSFQYSDTSDMYIYVLPDNLREELSLRQPVFSQTNIAITRGSYEKFFMGKTLIGFTHIGPTWYYNFDHTGSTVLGRVEKQTRRNAPPENLYRVYKRNEHLLFQYFPEITRPIKARKLKVSSKSRSV